MVADDPTTPPQEISFHADGTYIQYDGTGGVGIGTLEPTGASSGMVTIVQYGLMTPARSVTPRSGPRSRSRRTARACPRTTPSSYFGSDGSDTGQMGPGTVTGTRIPGRTDGDAGDDPGRSRSEPDPVAS